MDDFSLERYAWKLGLRLRESRRRPGRFIVEGPSVHSSKSGDYHCVKNFLSGFEQGFRARKALDCEVIEDGFGSEHPIICFECGMPTMEVVRPGKFQCGNCG